MSKLSKLAETLIGSEIVKLGNAISERINKGEKIYNYTIGDFNPSIFPIPKLLEDLIVEEYRNRSTNYPAAEGIVDLRKAIAYYLKEWQDFDCNIAEIQVASGGRPIIYSTFRAIVDAGDKVIYGVPSWNNNHYTHLTGGEHCLIDCKPENNFMPLAEDVEKHIKGATLICLCTPQNPTGTTISKESLEKICDLIIEENNSRGENEKKLYLLYDQMYWTLTYGDVKHDNPILLRPAMKDYTIFVGGISKSLSATGVRVGWGIGPAHIIAKMKAILSHIGAWAPTAEQKATAKFLTNTSALKEFTKTYIAELEYRLQHIYKGFIALKEKGYQVDAIAPQAAIYLTIKINLVGKKTTEGNVLDTQEAVTAYLLSEAKLAIVPFYCFGASKNSAWYRLSIGTCKKEEIAEMFNKLEEALSKLH
ncbi:MAG: pyridoxal phosphate-dependent aminotransferase [Chitinophagaceae bacterium]|nr:pyridoxal phosphate-dependent aminotransferase [Chitinophagaceae bacterium]MCW5904935.1 pyridoxal phosphate-dependent aminotransferase [Chitinophagaceae bacterium]